MLFVTSVSKRNLYILMLSLAPLAVSAKDSKVLCGTGKKCRAKGADITKLNLDTVPITVPKNFPDNGETITLISKIASQDTKGKDILFIHGFPHCYLLWKNQLADNCLRSKHNLYTLDMRGHGESDKPDPSAPPSPDGTDTVYRPWQNYANDIHQTILQLGLNKPILVMHSYSGFLFNDYLRMFGDSEISGIVLLSTIPDPFLTLATQTQWFTPQIQELGMMNTLAATDLTEFIPSTQEFGGLSSACQLSQQDLQEVLMYNSVVSGPTRLAVINHNGLPPVGTGLPSPNDTVWQEISVPTKIIHGLSDCVIEPAAAEHLSQVIPNAKLCLLEGLGHFICLEDPKKFNRILLEFFNTVKCGHHKK